MEYRSRMIVCQKEVHEHQISSERQTMALHNAEEEIVRLQSLLNAAASVAPIVHKAVLKAAPGFDFKDRGLEVNVLSCHHFFLCRQRGYHRFFHKPVHPLEFWLVPSMLTTSNVVRSSR